MWITIHPFHQPTTTNQHGWRTILTLQPTQIQTPTPTSHQPSAATTSRHGWKRSNPRHPPALSPHGCRTGTTTTQTPPQSSNNLLPPLPQAMSRLGRQAGLRLGRIRRRKRKRRGWEKNRRKGGGLRKRKSRRRRTDRRGRRGEWKGRRGCPKLGRRLIRSDSWLNAKGLKSKKRRGSDKKRRRKNHERNQHKSAKPNPPLQNTLQQPTVPHLPHNPPSTCNTCTTSHNQPLPPSSTSKNSPTSSTSSKSATPSPPSCPTKSSKSSQSPSNNNPNHYPTRRRSYPKPRRIRSSILRSVWRRCIMRFVRGRVGTLRRAERGKMGENKNSKAGSGLIWERWRGWGECSTSITTWTTPSARSWRNSPSCLQSSALHSSLSSSTRVSPSSANHTPSNCSKHNQFFPFSTRKSSPNSP